MRRASWLWVTLVVSAGASVGCVGSCPSGPCSSPSTPVEASAYVPSTQAAASEQQPTEPSGSPTPTTSGDAPPAPLSFSWHSPYNSACMVDAAGAAASTSDSKPGQSTSAPAAATFADARGVKAPEASDSAGRAQTSTASAQPADPSAAPAVAPAPEAPNATPADSASSSTVSGAHEADKMDGTVSNAVQVVSGMREGFRDCFNASLAHNPNQQGTVRLTIQVNCIGSVYALLVESEGLEAEVGRCMVDVVAASRFMPPSGGHAVVAVPVTFVKQ